MPVHSFDYAIVRIVPLVERQEFINIGVILFARTLDYLNAKIDMSLNRLKVFPLRTDPESIKKQLQGFVAICQGNQESGYFRTLSKSERFNWLVAPSSTVVQASPVHTGLCEDPKATLDDLFKIFVAARI